MEPRMEEEGAEAASLLDGCIERLAKERAENQACPDEDERNKVLLTMLEFAASEVAPDLFKAIADEIGVDSLQETPFLKAYTVFDQVKQTEGDGIALEELLEEFVQTIINYEGRKESAALNEVRGLLAAEMKAQICLGKFLSTRKWNEHNSPDDANLRALEDSIRALFPVEGADDGESYEALVRDELMRLLQCITDFKKPAGHKSGKRRDEQAKAEEMLEATLDKHSWERFLEMLRLYVSVLLYTVHDGPQLLASVRNMGLGPVNQIPHKHMRNKRSHKYSMLVRVFKAIGGTPAAWQNIINKSETEGQETLKNILLRAEEVRAAKHQQGPKADDEHMLPEQHHDLDLPDEEIYGEEDEYESDGDVQQQRYRMDHLEDIGSPRWNGPRASKGYNKPRHMVKVGKRPYAAPSQEEYDELISLDHHAGSSKKRRRKPVNWTQEETDALMKGVEIFGMGHWAKILQHFNDVFSKNNRSSVSLKDRFRNLEIRKSRQDQKDKVIMNV